MHLAHTLEARQQQTQRIDPRQILASEILAWTTGELESAVERELAENPALEAKDDGAFESPSGFPAEERNQFALLPISRSEATIANGAGEMATRGQFLTTSCVSGDEDDPLDRVACGRSLHDHLREQAGQVAAGQMADLVRFLIEWVDDRGYLIAQPLDVAERFRVSRSLVEDAIQRLQSMDPPGVGARDLRECLILQTEYLESTGEAHPLAKRLLENCWEELAARRDEKIASRLRAPLADVRGAVAFIQKSLIPYPGSAFRASWQSRGTSASQAVRPDIVFVRTETGFHVELTRDFEATLSIAPLWKRLAERPDAGSDEAMRRYVREHVDRAQTFLTGITRRGQTLRRIARELAQCQQGYLETGNRAFLRPLTRQMLAERLGLDESVVSRAVTDKWAQLPGGEVVLLDSFFGNAHAVRDALVQLVASEDPATPYSDDEIADILTAQGFPLARRTVAKYRALEKILPARLRRRIRGTRQGKAA